MVAVIDTVFYNTDKCRRLLYYRSWTYISIGTGGGGGGGGGLRGCFKSPFQ